MFLVRIFILFIFPLFLFGQNEAPYFSDYEWGELSEDELQTLFEELENLRSSPVSLSLENLREYVYLFPSEIVDKIGSLSGDIRTWRELEKAGFERKQILFLKNYFYESNEIREKSLHGDISMAVNESGLRHSMRWITDLKRLKFALVTDRDPGETALWDYSGGYFCYSYSAGDVLIGTLKIQSGLGLYFAPGKTMFLNRNLPVSLSREYNKITGTTSRLENGYPIGIALTGSGLFWRYGAFLTHTLRDGYIFSGDVHLPESGKHLTSLEISRKDALAEDMQGFTFTHIHPEGEEGFLVASTRIRDKNSVAGEAVFRQRAFSFHGNRSFREMLNISTELVLQNEGEGAFAVAGRLRLPGGELITALRAFSRRYVALYSEYFNSLSSLPQDEKGIIAGIKLKPYKGIALVQVIDISKPVNGAQFLTLPFSETQLTHFSVRNRLVKMDIEFTSRRKRIPDKKVSEVSLLKITRRTYKHSFIFNPSGNFKTGVALKEIRVNEGDTGFSASSLAWFATLYKSAFSLNVKAVYYSSIKGGLLFEYLPGIPGVFSIVNCSGEGIILGGYAFWQIMRGGKLYAGFQSQKGINGLIRLQDYQWSVQMCVDL